MKNPKEKAKELVFRFGKIDHINDRCMPFEQAIQCALICVNQILFELEDIEDGYRIDRVDYWYDVKKEIIML